MVSKCQASEANSLTDIDKGKCHQPPPPDGKKTCRKNSSGRL